MKALISDFGDSLETLVKDSFDLVDELRFEESILQLFTEDLKVNSSKTLNNKDKLFSFTFLACLNYLAMDLNLSNVFF